MSDEVFDPAWSEETGEPTPEVVPEPQEPEAAPLGYIEVRTERWSTFDGFNVKEAPRISMRPRLPEDGDAPFRVVKTPMPIPQLEAKPREKEENERRSDWKPGVPEALLRKVLGPEDPEAPGQNDSSSFMRWMRGGFGRR